jgi:hypothetical protein
MSVATPDFPEIGPSLFESEIIQLREWGTRRVHPLPAEAVRCLLGTGGHCPVQLSAPDVLPTHAQLVRKRQQWLIRALGDTPGLWRDGARCDAFSLEPGVEIGVGSVMLIAESRYWIDLRDFCARIIGWDADHLPLIDHALRSIRMSLARRAPLLLCGKGNLVPIAHALHRRTLGADRPFVLCDPRRDNGRESVRSAANYKTGAVAVKMALGGSLCVRKERLPRDLAAMLAEVRELDAYLQLVICSSHPREREVLATPVHVPSLEERTKDLPRIVDEYALDATAALHVPPTAFTSDDRAWVLENAASSLEEIEKATLRCVAIRTSDDLPHAAERLGMAKVSLERWMARHDAPTGSSAKP